MSRVRPVVRLSSTVLWGLLGAAVGAFVAALAPAAWRPSLVAVGIVALIGLAVGYLAPASLLLAPFRRIRSVLRTLPTWMLVATIFGLATGLFLGFLLASPLAALPGSAGDFTPLAVSLLLSVVGVLVFLALGQDFYARLAPRVLSSAEPDTPWATANNGHLADNPIVLDTSAIIDGRIADVSQSGFLQGKLVIPRFVLEELRHIADSSDPQRRNRGRRGLEMLNRLRREAIIPVEVIDTDPEGLREVDDKLVAVAAQMNGRIVTTDFNLNRVAELQGVSVLNVNLLANALRPVVIPGEDLHVFIQQEGKEHNQGLAFLEDGTMIVVEGGRRFIGHDLDVAVTRVLQTAAGRIIFSHPKDV